MSLAKDYCKELLRELDQLPVYLPGRDVNVGDVITFGPYWYVYQADRRFSTNIDYAISPNALWRLEGRVFESKDQIFTLDNAPDRQNYFVTSSIAISF